MLEALEPAKFLMEIATVNICRDFVMGNHLEIKRKRVNVLSPIIYDIARVYQKATDFL